MSAARVPALQAIYGQEEAAAFLANALDGGRVGHAYLFVGPPGSGRLDAARALAMGLVCPHGGCGHCDDCGRVARGTHPDVHELAPESAQGYLVGQVRGLIAELDLAPVCARRRVFVLDRADALGPASANALLKSLEEPPDDVVFVLLGTSADAILPTVLSRCQTVPFKPIDRARVARRIADEEGVAPVIALRALACCSSPSDARGFVRSESRQQARRHAIAALARLERADALDVLGYAREAVLAAKAPLSEFKDAQAAALDENAKVLSSSALRELEERQKRELSARERSGIMESFAAQSSFLRDALGTAAGTGDPRVCDDFAAQADAFAARLGTDGVLRALGEVDRARARVDRNVSPQLAMESMLFTVKEMFACQP